jgi:ABC-type lipoprotein release transport system permease subunit
MAGGMVASSNNVAPGMIFGVQPEKEGNISKLKEALVEGSFLTPGSQSEILIGYKMADLLEVELGDRIVVTVAEAESGEMSQALFRVSGYLRFNDRTMDQEMAFVSLAAGQAMLAIGDGIHEIAIRFAEGADQDLALQRLTQALGEDGPELLGWQGLMPEMSAMLEIYDFSILIIGAILFFLISFGLINSMYMSIYERHYEFGVMLGLGTRPRRLFALVCCEGLLIGVLGAIFGVICGGLITYYVSTVGIGFSGAEFAGITIDEPIKTIVRVQQFTIIPAYIIVLTGLACILPALHGARLQPADALRRAL